MASDNIFFPLIGTIFHVVCGPKKYDTMHQSWFEIQFGNNDRVMASDEDLNT